MTYFTAILLGLVQGITEFLPVSSSGHLAILQSFLHIGDLENDLLFDVLLHFGTLVAVCAAFRKEISDVLKEGLRMVHLVNTPRGVKPDRLTRRLLLMLIIAEIPLVLVLLFHDSVEALYRNTVFIGLALIVTGGLLFAADRVGHGNKSERDCAISDALIVGLAQAAAVTPGLSRSGTTISFGMLRGFDRNFAVRFSFLLSIPAVIGASVYSVAKAVRAGIVVEHLPMYLVGMLFAAVSGYMAIRLLRLLVQKGKFGGFAYYCWGAGILTLILSLVS